MKQVVNQAVIVAGYGYGFDATVCRCQTEDAFEVWAGTMVEPIYPLRPVLLRISCGEEGNLAALLTPEDAVTLAKVLVLLASGEMENVTVQ